MKNTKTASFSIQNDVLELLPSVSEQLYRDGEVSSTSISQTVSFLLEEAIQSRLGKRDKERLKAVLSKMHMICFPGVWNLPQDELSNKKAFAEIGKLLYKAIKIVGE